MSLLEISSDWRSRGEIDRFPDGCDCGVPMCVDPDDRVLN
jgi:hypothetical protein